jgi:beta-glucanase (GH16 family)
MPKLLRRTSLLLAVTGLFALLLPGGPAGAAAHPAAPKAQPAPNCGAAIARPSGGTWTCTFDDEFNGSSLDSSKWAPVTTAASGLSGGGACFINSTNNIQESGGTLNLTVRKESRPFVCASPKGNFATQYTSGQVATYGKFGQTLGRFSVRAQFPAATVAGLQSSLWLWPQSNDTNGLYGEIDIAEEYSIYADRAVPYLHYLYNPATVNPQSDVNIVSNNNCLIQDVHAFHEYTVEWTASTLTVQFDDQTCLVDNFAALGPDPFNQPFFVALTQSLGLGTNAYAAGSTPLPATTAVDWVRVWK